MGTGRGVQMPELRQLPPTVLGLGPPLPALQWVL